MRVARTQLTQSTGGLKAAAATVGTSMARVGKGVGAVGIGVAAVSVKMAADFQSETAVLQTAAGESAKGLTVVRKGILNISQGTGTGIKNLTDGMYLIEKAGFRGAGGLQVLKAAAQGAREENAKLSDVTNAMTSIMASYHLKTTDAVRVMNGMKTAAGEGKITMEEFSGAMSTVLPIASANKISFEQVAGAVATLTQHGTSAREATHELGATIRALASPNMVAQREMARFGLSSVDVSQKIGKRGLTGTFDLLTSTILSKMGPSGKILLSAFEGTKQSAEDARIMVSKLPPELQKQAKAFVDGKIEMDDWKAVIKGADVTTQPMLRNLNTLVNRSRGFSRELKSGGPAAKTYTDALKKMSGGAIGLNTVLQLSGESTAGFKERVKKVGESFHNGSKDVEGWKITQGLLNVQLARAKQGMQVLAIEIGTKLIPVVSSVIGLFLRHRSVLMGVVTAIGILAGSTVAAYVGMKLYALYTGVATAATWLFSTANGASNAQILILRAQLAGLWIMQKLQAASTVIVTAAQWAWNAAMDANPIGLIILAVAALVAGIIWVATKTQFFQTVWKAVWGGIKTAFSGFVSWFKANWQLLLFGVMTLGIGVAVAEIVRHWDGIKHMFSATIDWIKANWPLILAILGGPIGLAVLYIVNHWKQISDGAKNMYHAVINWFIQMGKDIGTFFTSTLPGFFKALPDAVDGFITKANNAMLSFAVTAGKAIGGFFTSLPGKLAGWGKSFYQANLDTGKNLIAGLLDGATTFFTKQIPAFFAFLWHGLVDYFKAVFGIHSPSTVFASMGMDLMRGLFNGMVTIASTVGTWLHTHVYSPMVSFFTNAVSWLVSAGRSVIHGLVNGARTWWAAEASWWTSRGRTIIGWFANAASWLVQHGREVINGLVNGAKQWWANETSWWTGRGRAIAGWFSGAASWLVGQGRNVINGLLSGMKSTWKSLTSWVSGIAKWIKDHKGPISLDARLLTPAGKALMHGLLKGLKIGFKDVGDFVYGTGNSIADVTKQIGGMIFGSVGLGTSKGVEKYRDLVTFALRMLGQPISYADLVLKRMNQESGGNPTIVNRWDCLTLDAMILTKRGWLKHDQVHEGDLTVGYNPETGRSEWTRINRVVHFADAPLVKMSNSRWSATTTPNHRWINLPKRYKPKAELLRDTCQHCEWPDSTRRRGKTTSGGLRIHLAKAHGIRSGKAETEIVSRAEWVNTANIGNPDRILLSAPADTKSTLDITVQEAALLGWVAGDGHIENPCPTPGKCARQGYTKTGICKAHHARQNPSMSVAQSKPAMVEKLRVLLADIPHSVYVDDRLTRYRNNPVGPRHVFRIGYEFAQDLLRRAGHPRGNAVDQVLAMSSEQREAWLEAITDAEGHRADATEGSKTQVVIYQRPGDVLDAIALAVYLSGSRPRIAHSKRQGQPNWSPEALVRMNNPIITGQSLTKEDAGHGDVWCVTTDLGSWTTRQDDHIFLTGNSNWKAGHPSVGLMQVIRGTFAAYAGKYRKTGPFEYGVSTNAMANIYAGLNYALHRYGSLSALGRPGGYDSGGIARGVGYMAKNTLKPERVLSPRQTVAFDRLVGAIANPAGGGGSSGTVYHIEHLHVDSGVIGSQHELENWFMGITVSLKKKGRLK